MNTNIKNTLGSYDINKVKNVVPVTKQSKNYIAKEKQPPNTNIGEGRVVSDQFLIFNASCTTYQEISEWQIPKYLVNWPSCINNLTDLLNISVAVHLVFLFNTNLSKKKRNYVLKKLETIMSVIIIYFFKY